jgi:hypothetical protein
MDIDEGDRREELKEPRSFLHRCKDVGRVGPTETKLD